MGSQCRNRKVRLILILAESLNQLWREMLCQALCFVSFVSLSCLNSRNLDDSSPSDFFPLCHSINKAGDIEGEAQFSGRRQVEEKNLANPFPRWVVKCQRNKNYTQDTHTTLKLMVASALQRSGTMCSFDKKHWVILQ